MLRNGATHNPLRFFSSALIFVAIIAICYVMAKVNIAVGLALAASPFLILLLFSIIKWPYVCFVLVFVAHYFIIPISRYTGLSGLSVIIDILFALNFMTIILNSAFIKPINTDIKYVRSLLFVQLIWLGYCLMEVLNPTAMISAWVTSRALMYYMACVTMLSLYMVDNFRKVIHLLDILAVLTLIGIVKALIQKYVGFDAAELQALQDDLGKTHLLVSGTRYFSIYASAGIFGVVMGSAIVTFGCAALYVKSNARRIFYLTIAAMSLYGLLISGTRGALAVPGVGFMLFALLSKKARIIVPITMVSCALYVILAMTTIGQSNATIRRVRSVFDPNEPSLMVRKDNQAKFREYLHNRPFGEGLGLSGVEAQSSSQRFTTSIPTDSWYVKIWVETGVVGLMLYFAMLGFILVRGCYIIMFKIQDKEIRGILAGLMSAVFGIFVSSYGNLVLGQFPVAIVTYSCITFVFMGPYFERQKELSKQQQ